MSGNQTQTQTMQTRTKLHRFADWISDWHITRIFVALQSFFITVVSLEGQLIYRRVLLHSHAEEQPFTRPGGPVNVQPGQTVIVRAHMNGTGYGGAGLRGSAAGGFAAVKLPKDFGADLETRGPLPTGCAF